MVLALESFDYLSCGNKADDGDAGCFDCFASPFFPVNESQNAYYDSACGSHCFDGT